MKRTEIKIEDVFYDVINKGSITTEQMTKLNIFFSQNDVKSDITNKFV